MSTVILAEKPSQALAYASALKQSTKKDGYFEIKDPLFTDETFITFSFGHLVELTEPGHYNEKWQNWKLESLPIFPDRYDFEVAKDKGKQFKIVAELLKKANTIIVATDSDREGENIAWSIIHKAYASVHLDESTPHMHMGVIPLKDGKLSSKTMFTKAELVKIQTELPDYLASKGFNVVRGQEKSQAKHLRPSVHITP